MQITRIKAVLGALGGATFLLGTAVATITVDGFTDDVFPADAALVLGNTVRPDGTPSRRLRGRLERGAALYHDGVVPVVVVSGGLGKEGHWEGDVMAEVLVGLGVPRGAIRVDHDGVNTMASARNLAGRAEVSGWDSVIAVSQFFHLSRCRLALRKAGIDEVGTAHATVYEWRDGYATLREVPAYVKYWWLELE